MDEKFCLKIQIMSDGSRLRYEQLIEGSVFDMVSLPISKSTAAVLITMNRHPGDTRLEISRKQAATTIAKWKELALDVLLVDHRKATQEIVLPSGIALNATSNLLLLVKAFQQWQKGQIVLAQDDALALKVWIGDRVPFGTEAVEKIHDMKVIEQLEDI